MTARATPGHRGLFLFTILAGLLLAAVLALPASQGRSQEVVDTGEPGLNPVLTTDKADYAPGETVIVTGSGFAPNTSYDIPVIRPDGTIVRGDGAFEDDFSYICDVTDPTVDQCWDTITTDGDGGFTYAYILDGIIGLYEVRAYTTPWSGDRGEVPAATVTFLDGNVLAKTSGPTVTFNWKKYNGNTTCSGVPSSSGSVVTGTSSSLLVAVDLGQSIEITVPSLASGLAFDEWTGTASFGTSSSNPLCMAGVNGNRTMTANYLRTTSTAVVCVPNPVTIPAVTTCTATVSDTPAGDSAPSGTVTFDTSGTDTFSGGSSCSLSGAGLDSRSCSLTYTPSTAGNHDIGASYAGSATHAGSFTGALLGNDAGDYDLTVTAANTAPVAVDDTYTTNEDTNLILDAVAVGPNASPIDNDTDANGNTLTATAVSNPAGGTATLVSGTITFTPTANLCGAGAGSFDYTVSDGNGGTDTGRVTVNIACLDDPPVAVNDGATVNEDSVSNAINVLANDTDIDGGTKTVQSVTAPANGAAAVDGGGTGVTYTPNPNYCGPDSFTYTLNGGSTATVAVTVTCLADAPVAADDVATVLEDSINNPINVLANDTDPDNQSPPLNAGLSVTAVTVPSNGAAAFTAAGVTYTPDSDYCGADGFNYTVSDGALADTASVSVTVTCVDDPPVAVNDTATVLEDSGANSLDVLGNDTDIDGGTKTVASVTQPAGGTVVITNGGADLTYEPDANYCNDGAPTDDFTYTLNGGSTATVAVTVTCVNDAPSFVAGADETVLEDAGAQSVAGWATGISAGPGDESGQALTFNVSNDDNALFSVQPAVSPTGTLSYTPAANAFGTATVTVTLSDNGGTANGGVDTTAAQTFSITVTPVNDAPSFTVGADVTVNEDSGAYSAAWATAISAGPANESGQALTFNVSNDNNGLFAAQPAISSTGMLTFTPAANANGSATVTVSLEDDGGTADGGVDTTADVTFTITVTAVNDAPSFVAGADETVLEDAGAQSVGGWATSISAGPMDESGQALTFNVSNDNNALFSVQPAVSPTGTLSYTPAANAFGTATVTVTLSDNGGTANDGVDTSAAQAFTITVTPVNDAPVISNVSASPTSIDEGQSTTVTVTFGDVEAGDSHACDFNWGDGSPTSTVNVGPGATSCATSHSYVDDNPTVTGSDVYTVGVTVTDNGAPVESDSGSTTVTVNNVDPVIGIVTGPLAPVLINTATPPVSASFTDVGGGDTHTCSINWDDGSTTPGSVTESNGAGTCSGTHTYAAQDIYTVVITVTDDDGGSASATFQYVVIFDPSGGFVTGGGWITSPDGAYTANTSLTGKANFGFVSKYKKGSHIPEGNTEFQFKAGNLNFHSTAYEIGSLVISGSKATYKGTGTVNGVAGYSFRVVAIDGQVSGGGGVDKFRIKIWVTGSPSNVVYDNQMGAADDAADATLLGGGSIVIHKAK